MAAITVSGSCSNTEGTKALPPQEGRRPGAVGSGGAATNLKGDDEFVHEIAAKNIATIELSRMALAKAASHEVKAFAQTVMDEDSAAGTKLKSVDLGSSSQWPAGPDDEHREAANDLAEKQGADFDREYVKAIIATYQDLTAVLESRLDVQSLADWKTAAAGRTQSKAMPDPDAALNDVQIRPHRSSNETTRKINQWAADTYPVAQKHLDTARTLENAMKQR